MSHYIRSIIFSVLAFWVISTYSPGLHSVVIAQTVPSFSSCTNPQGSVKADNPSGTHGIVGESGNYSGSDTVYRLSGDTLTQCFCSQNNQGIQTNWWKITSLSPGDIAVLEREGWIYVPNGKLWGLDEGAYLAKNAPYVCSGGRVGGASATNVGDVLGLATTGNMPLLLGLLAIGLLSLLIAFLLKRRSNVTE